MTYLFLNFSSANIEVWEWISNIILHFTGYVITYPCWIKAKPCYWKLGGGGGNLYTHSVYIYISNYTI